MSNQKKKEEEEENIFEEKEIFGVMTNNVD